MAPNLPYQVRASHVPLSPALMFMLHSETLLPIALSRGMGFEEHLWMIEVGMYFPFSPLGFRLFLIPLNPMSQSGSITDTAAQNHATQCHSRTSHFGLLAMEHPYLQSYLNHNLHFTRAPGELYAHRSVESTITTMVFKSGRADTQVTFQAY